MVSGSRVMELHVYMYVCAGALLVLPAGLHATLRYGVGSLAVSLGPDGVVTVGHVSADSMYLDPTEDAQHVSGSVQHVQLLDAQGAALQEYNFTAQHAAFHTLPDPVHDLGEVPVDGRRMQPTGTLRRQLGPRSLLYNEYVFVEDAATDLGDQQVQVHLYHTKLEFILGPPADTDSCPDCASRTASVQLHVRLTSAGPSRLSTQHGLTTVHKDAGVQILLPSAIMVDGAAQITEGNPAIEVDGDHVDVSLEFPAFSNNASYQALIIPAKPSTADDSKDDGEVQAEGEPEEESEAEYSFSTKPPDSDIIVGPEGNVKENNIEGDGSKETAQSSGPDNSKSDNPNSSDHSIAAVHSLAAALLVCVLVGH